MLFKLCLKKRTGITGETCHLVYVAKQHFTMVLEICVLQEENLYLNSNTPRLCE